MKSMKLLSISLMLISLSLCACDNYKDPSSVEIELSDVSDNIDIHTEFQNQLLNSDDPDQFVAKHNDEISYQSLSAPNKVKVTYSLSSDNGSAPKEVLLRVSENSDMSNPMDFKGSEIEAEIYNFKIGKTYYYQVVGTYKSAFKSEIKSFTVSNNTPRNLYVDGVENVRDLGGWSLEGGHVYKQGLIYRTAQFNYAKSGNTFKSAPTELGLKVLKQDLKIKTDIDLRRTLAFDNNDEVSGITSSPLGSDVTYLPLPMKYGGENIFDVEKNIENIKSFFEALSDINNYTISFNCMRGTDRTGALAYVLGAILGMSEEDLNMDYLFSNFARLGGVVRLNGISSKFVAGIKNSEGDTYSMKATNYLISTCGVSLETINQIKNILID